MSTSIFGRSKNDLTKSLQLLSVTARRIVGTARRIDSTGQIQLKINQDCAENPTFKFIFVFSVIYFLFDVDF